MPNTIPSNSKYAALLPSCPAHPATNGLEWNRHAPLLWPLWHAPLLVLSWRLVLLWTMANTRMSSGDMDDESQSDLDVALHWKIV